MTSTSACAALATGGRHKIIHCGAELQCDVTQSFLHQVALLFKLPFGLRALVSNLKEASRTQLQVHHLERSALTILGLEEMTENLSESIECHSHEIAR